MPKAIPLRINRLRAAMAEQDLDAIVVLKPQNSYYMSGFNPIIYSHPVVAIMTADGTLTLLVHALRDDISRSTSFVEDVRLYGAWSTKVTMGPSWLAALASILGERGIAKGLIGLDLDFISFARARDIETHLPGASLTDASDLIMKCRYVKDSDEIACARDAAHLANHGMSAAIAALRGGGSERDIALASMAAMNRVWTDEFPNRDVCDFGNLEHGVHNGLFAWALTGERMFLNTAPPTVRVPAKGETAAVLLWSVIDGIHVESERTLMIGGVAPETERALEAITEIRADVIGRIRPGVLYSDLFDTARTGFEAHGYGRYLPGRIGHSMGLGAHELPSIDPTTRVLLEAGMIIAVEPNLRIPGEVATQISDTVLVTEKGYELLTTSEVGLLRA